jgi:hypothetical protein
MLVFTFNQRGQRPNSIGCDDAQGTTEEPEIPRQSAETPHSELTAPDRIVCVPNSDAENKSLEAPFQITVRFALLRNSYARNTNGKPLK